MASEKQKQFRFKINKKVTIFAVCVMVATVFWLLNALSKSYIIALAVPLNYVEVPEGYAITNQPPTYVQVRIEGDGFNLLSVDEVEHDPVAIKTATLFPETGLQTYKAIVTTKDLQKQLQSELGSSISILGVSHDSLQLSIERLAKSEVPVLVQNQIQLANGFTIANLTAKPDSIIIQGPVSIVSQLNSVVTDTLSRSGVEESFSQVLGLQLPSRYTTATPNQVTVEVAVEALTEGTIEVPIQVLHVPDSLMVNVYPSTVELKFTVPLSEFQQIKSEQFSAYVDYTDVIKSHPYKLKIAWGTMPVHTTRLDYNPKRVEYIIRNR